MRSLVVALVLLVAGCAESPREKCPASGATASCAEACAHLFDIDCRVGAKRSECTATCEAASQNLDDDTRGRVLACYAVADECRDVDGCGRACGTGGGPVTFVELDAGGGASEAGPEPDASPDGG